MSDIADPQPSGTAHDLGPGVKFPPPLVFVVGFALGAMLSRVLPLGAPWTLSTLTLGVGGSLIMIGVAVALTGVITLNGRAWRCIPIGRPTSS